MKRWKVWLAAVCILLLCACSNQKRTVGRVLSFENGLLCVQTEEGKRYDFLVDSQETAILDPVSRSPEETLDENCRVRVNWTGTRRARKAELVWVDSRLRRNALQLSDGTPIDLWERNGWREYCLEDGTVLLMEEKTGAPDKQSHWNELLYYEDFTQEAQQGILRYYSEMGQRYDLPALLEDARQVYAVSQEYHTKLVGQHVGIEAWNDQIICCQMNLTIPQARTNGYADFFCEGAVFDRKTGEVISNYDLFVITPEELEEYLLDKLDNDGMLDRGKIRLNLKPEQIVLRQDGGIEFFLVDRTEGDYSGMLQIGLSSEQAQEILQPWARFTQKDIH